MRDAKARKQTPGGAAGVDTQTLTKDTDTLLPSLYRITDIALSQRS